VLEALVAVTVPAAICVPHLLPLHRVAPGTASAVWLLALCLRALVTIAAAIFFFLYLPQTELFSQVASWCLHNILPIISGHLGLSGHPLAHFAAVLPGLVIAASVLWMLAGLARAWIALRVHLARRALGLGPHGSTVVDDDEIVVAVTRLGRGRIVVSRTALGLLDRDELEASLAHELGHLHLRHRPLLVIGALLSALARPLPGTRGAHRALIFNLERHADEYAVARTRDPLALASAIAKAAVPAPAGMAGLGGQGGVALRMSYLVAGGCQRSARGIERLARATCALLALLVLGLSATLPAWGLTAPAKASAADLAVDDCHH
jgi:Zn-dependent protease with chaperone function